MSEENKDKPEPEKLDYYDKIHRATWVRRVAGTMTGATMGAMFGAVIGIVAAFLPYTLGALGVAGATAVAMPALLTVASTAALFAGAAAFIGIALASDVGANAGSIAAGLEEKEKREEAKGLYKSQEQSPSQEAQKTNDVPNGNGAPKYFSWKVASITAPLFDAFGALIAANPHPAVSSALAMMTGSVGGLGGVAAMVASAVVFGMFGACIGAKNAMFSNKISNFYSKLITDKFFVDAPEKAPAVQPSAEPVLVPAVTQYEPQLQQNGKIYADTAKRFSLQDLLAREDKSTKPEMAWTRN